MRSNKETGINMSTFCKDLPYHFWQSEAWSKRHTIVESLDEIIDLWVFVTVGRGRAINWFLVAIDSCVGSIWACGSGTLVGRGCGGHWHSHLVMYVWVWFVCCLSVVEKKEFFCPWERWIKFSLGWWMMVDGRWSFFGVDGLMCWSIGEDVFIEGKLWMRMKERKIEDGSGGGGIYIVCSWRTVPAWLSLPTAQNKAH